MKTETNKPLRAAGYCRTSGEKQRDNTSIPRQKIDIEKSIAMNGWKLIHHYEDESLSGSTIDGRTSFQQMMVDAANGKFDIVVCWDISRFARDGFDIINESRTLKRTFGIDTVDCKGFDTRDHRKTFTNFVFAGLSQNERLTIMERTINARIHNAQNGLQWAPKPPFGRTFTKTGKHSGTWGISDDGKRMRNILQAYVHENRSFRELAREYGMLSGQRITRIVREAQLAADPYIAVFNSPEIGIEDLKIEIPAVPAVITKALEKRVLAKMALNHKTKRYAKRNYLLSGMVRCAHCGMYLKGQSQRGRSYYTHNNFFADKKPCPYNGIRLELLETHVMDYLTTFIFDQPSFEKAIKDALPTNNDREAIVKDIQSNTKALDKVNRRIKKLVLAIADGADASLILDTQNQLKAEKLALENRAVELKQTLDSMPDPEAVKEQADIIRMKLMMSKITENWEDKSYEDLRRFLHFLFSDNPRQNNYGILLGKQDDMWHISFDGCFEFAHSITTPNNENTLLHHQIRQINDETRKMFEESSKAAIRKYVATCKKAGIEPDFNALSNDNDYL